MSYIDMAVGVAFFLFFLTLVLLTTIQHFVRSSAMVEIEEFRERSIDLFIDFFTRMGLSTDWEETDENPSELGLAMNMYVKPILVGELGIANRENEPAIVNLIVDEDCENRAWNNSLRIYDLNLTEVKYEFVNPVFCSDQFLNESYVRFNVNISQNGEKTLFAYYFEDSDVQAPDYTMSYDTAGWVPTDGDSWSETTSSWSRYEGSTGSPETNDLTKIRGASSIQINGTFDDHTLGLTYDPVSMISGVSNGWYIDSWIYLDSVSGVSGVNVSVSDSIETITAKIDVSAFNNGWYHFERELSSNKWDGWGSFNASDGIDRVSFYMLNSTAGITRQMNIDELHFEVEPLDIKAFPEEAENIISNKKIAGLGNLTYEELREVLGENHRYRIKIR